MKKKLTLIVSSLFMVLMTAQAHALFTECTLDFEAQNVDLLVFGGIQGEGVMTCRDAVGHKKSDRVGIMAAGLSIGAGVCNVSGQMQYVGAGLTWNNVMTLFATAELGPVLAKGKSISAGVAVSPTNPNVQIGVGVSQYSKACLLHLGSAKLGGVMSIEDYENAIEARLKRQRDIENYGGR